MTLSKNCWLGHHFKCKYIGCYCDCHDFKSEMRKLLKELSDLTKKQRKEKAWANPLTPPPK